MSFRFLLSASVSWRNCRHLLSNSRRRSTSGTLFSVPRLRRFSLTRLGLSLTSLISSIGLFQCGSGPVEKLIVLSRFGSGGWTFRALSRALSNHRLRVSHPSSKRNCNQSQGYEPCGLNLDRLLANWRIYPTPLRREAPP